MGIVFCHLTALVPPHTLLSHPNGIVPTLQTNHWINWEDKILLRSINSGGHLEVEVGVLLPSPIDVLPTLPNQVSPYPEVSLILQNLLLYLHSSSVTYCSSPLVDAISLGMWISGQKSRSQCPLQNPASGPPRLQSWRTRQMEERSQLQKARPCFKTYWKIETQDEITLWIIVSLMSKLPRWSTATNSPIPKVNAGLSVVWQKI